MRLKIEPIKASAWSISSCLQVTVGPFAKEVAEPFSNAHIAHITLNQKKAMTIQDEMIGDVSIVNLNGSLDTVTSPDAEANFNNLIEADRLKILVDCANLDYISSAGLRVLLSASKRIHGRGGLVLCGMNEQVKEVFEMTGLAGLVFKIFETRDEALGGF